MTPPTGWTQRARTRGRGLIRLARLGAPIQRMKRRAPSVALTREQLEDLGRAWSNPAYQASIDYLELVSEHAGSVRSPVLECGSGLTTILLALTAARREIPVWSLEHDLAWYRSVRRVLARFDLRGVNLCYAPLIRYDSFMWYAVPPARLPDRFGLVVCDGPPGSTPGGRHGLMPVLGQRLAGATILVDDAERPAEAAMLADWTDTCGAISLLRTAQDGSQVASVRIPRPSGEERGAQEPADRWPS